MLLSKELPAYELSDVGDDSGEDDALTRQLTRELTQEFSSLELPPGMCFHASGAPSGASTPLPGSIAEPPPEPPQPMQLERAATMPPPQPERSLYDRLGGAEAVQAVVELFYDKLLADVRLGHFFDGIDMETQRRKQILFMSFVFGGPDEYVTTNPKPWPTLLKAHERLIREKGLNESHFDALAIHLVEAMQELAVPGDDMMEALTLVESTRRVIFPLPREQGDDCPMGDAPKQQ